MKALILAAALLLPVPALAEACNGDPAAYLRWECNATHSAHNDHWWQENGFTGIHAPAVAAPAPVVTEPDEEPNEGDEGDEGGEEI